jgi:predicted PurR-regulated permease PerM
MKNTSHIPMTVQAGIFIVGFCALLTLLYVAQDIIIPIVFSIIIAVLLNPIVYFFMEHKINRIFAIIFTLLLVFLIFSVCGLLIFTQIIKLSESWPILLEKFTLLANELIYSLSKFLDINPELIYNQIAIAKSDFGNNSIGKILFSLGNSMTMLVLVPVYVFIILLYRTLLIEFIHRLFSADAQKELGIIITQTKSLIQQYLIGLAIEVVLVAVMYAITLMLLGVEYAILLGIIGALLNIIPYIGGIVGVALPMMVALATKDSGWVAIYVLISYTLIQLVDNNYIVPKIVAGKVKINALFSIIAVFVGNAMWGVSGMFLSIPILAVIKLVFDHVDSLKPWGFLLGDTMPDMLKLKIKKRVNIEKEDV